MDLSISIVSYNTRVILDQCLSSIFNNTSDLTLQVIVVDNGSVDGSSEMVNEKFPQVRLIQNDRNLFFTKANNQAFDIAAGRYVLTLNSDVMVIDDALAKMVRFMDEHPQAGAATCLFLTPGDAVDINNCWRFHTPLEIVLSREPQRRLFGRTRVLQAGKMAEWDRRSVEQVEVVSDAFMMLRRETLDQIGAYDDRLSLYYTEDDMCRRLKEAGWTVHVNPHARIVHLFMQSTRNEAPSRIWNIRRSDAVHYFRKHHGPAAALAVWLAMLGEQLCRQSYLLMRAAIGGAE